MLAKTVLIEGESHERFNALLVELEAEFHPRPGVETTLVERMAVCRWRQLRLWGMEAASVTLEIRKHIATAEPASGSTHAALAIRSLTDSCRMLEFLTSYENRCERQYSRSLRRLVDLRARRGCKNNEIFGNEPEPANPGACQTTEDKSQLIETDETGPV
jgi:hypothetical protein